MSDRWIVSSFLFAEHGTAALAQAEAQRLHEKFGKEFRIYRIKDTLTAGETAAKIRRLEAEVERLRHAVPVQPAARPDAAACRAQTCDCPPGSCAFPLCIDCDAPLLAGEAACCRACEEKHLTAGAAT